MRIEPYKVGETAILINAETFTEYNNTQVIVIEPLTLRKTVFTDSMNFGESFSYIVECQDGRRLAAQPHQLKPKVADPVKEQNLAESV